MPEICIKEPIGVTAVKVLEGHKLLITFNDETCKEFDFAQVLAKGMPIFEPLKNLTVFRNIVLDGWTVTWQDGTIDIAPEYLYEHGVTV